MASVIAITSGKGGVGKTNVATNLAVALARKAKVCVFDADTGLANINLLLGIQPQYTLEHVLDGEKKIQDILINTANGLWIVPAASGVQRCVDLPEQKRNILVQALAELEKQFDYILIDTAAGIQTSVLDFVASAQFRIVVLTAEPTSLTDSFALLKMLKIRGVKRNLFVLVNRVDGYQSSQQVFNRFRQAVRKYLKLEIHYLGYLANDKALVDAVRQQIPVVSLHPEASVSCCFFALADIVYRRFLNEKNLPYFSHYWKKLSASGKKAKKRIVTEKQPDSDKAVDVFRQKAAAQINELSKTVNDEQFTHAQFDELMNHFGEIYRNRFGSGFFGDSKKLLEEIYQLLNRKS